jgi:hypothetical protein
LTLFDPPLVKRGGPVGCGASLAQKIFVKKNADVEQRQHANFSGLATSQDKPDFAGNPARFSVVPARFLRLANPLKNLLSIFFAKTKASRRFALLQL